MAFWIDATFPDALVKLRAESAICCWLRDQGHERSTLCVALESRLADRLRRGRGH